MELDDSAATPTTVEFASMAQSVASGEAKFSTDACLIGAQIAELNNTLKLLCAILQQQPVMKSEISKAS